MCGRFAASASTDDIVEFFGVEEIVDEPEPHFNLAPTDPIPAVVQRRAGDEGGTVRKLVAPRWGLVPSWSRDAKGAARMINARAETVAEKPAFRKAFATRRCLIPADGYYEWYVLPGQEGLKRPRKQPMFIRPADGGPFVMAGLYEFWRDPAGEWLTTATIITTTATDEIGHIHDRMPMVVAPADVDDWLDPALIDPVAAAALLRVSEGLESYAVSDLVNRVANDGPQLIEPLPGL